jgi:thiol-disulfide isomerase/thioredoxin
MPDKSGELDTVIIKKFPQTAQAELALINKIGRAAGIFYKEEKDKKVDEQNRSQFGIMLKDFIKRPKHYEDLYLADAYRYLYEYTRVDKKVSDAEFLQSARQYAEAASNSYPLSVAYTHSIIAEGLAERKMFREAEKFVNIGFEKVNKLIERQRENIKDEKRLEKQANEMNSALHSALGWTYFKENRLDEAEKEIEQAIKLAKENSRLYNRLGEIYEAKNVLDKAEDAYLKAFLTFIGKENPNVEVLKSLYRKRHNTLEGFETYFEKVKETERAMRKSLPPFTLKDVEGKSLSSADLKGKIVVINAWATWCVPCVKELPEFQELHKKYLGDKDVAILTINDGEDSAVVKKFMIDKKFDFAVLLDEKYLRSINDDILPTTWFIDRTGKISFTQLGYQGKILEEFVRRIEEMKK